MEHGSCRIANAIVKRVDKTLKDLIEKSAPDVACAARDAGKALVLELHKLLDEVKNVPHAERLAPRPTKAGNFDIAGGKMVLVHYMAELWPYFGITYPTWPLVALNFSY